MAMSPSEPLTKNSTYVFRLDADKDGAPWDLTGATVTLTFRYPDGTTAAKSATLTTPASGIAEYTTLTTDLTQLGRHEAMWRVVQGSIDLESLPEAFTVVRGR